MYYKDSFVLTQLRYFPYIQLAIIGIFLFVAYLIFSTSRRSEQNQVWVGLAKETAHQLGTPLSSMMAWVDYLETKGVDQDTIMELHKDVNRLKTVTDRFSKIGSTPILKQEDIIFNPGFSSKQRGWGLGLSLSKRIIREYHKGKIFVKSSNIGKGTTFRIILNK
ncbi:MAG: hypothetical protein IPH45_03380 [Bacteroidales bacterium]|nr:hypothetical protein [Bacteroidales bacterium]